MVRNARERDNEQSAQLKSFDFVTLNATRLGENAWGKFLKSMLLVARVKNEYAYGVGLVR
jgi:hypothetical protein